MEPFTTLTAVAVPLMRDNIDTDAIIPSREIRSVSKKGLADGLFAGWRYLAIGGRDPDPGFILNDAALKNARILVAGENFGCGSSREHAVWALAEYGFRAIVTPSFNPIFRNNCLANGVLPVILDRAVVEPIARGLGAAPGSFLTVDLEEQELRDEVGGRWRFDIDTEEKQALLSGLDPIARTLQQSSAIASFRDRDAQARPWAYSSIGRS
ncbi:3-isopropylmalate dehydratase small subunit [Parasphingopyxis lamellibrachiae]|uniref:3-isopropylmalate dehydratase small subunit n=1 Tax=Parasphingopyxis lamellibrachiae TaxID=680125 RepID=A0A3D9FG70_9SPHN|nr:3-isopropylmalate dehydratase small subunit [Parasphingopyxis lamellibrachiae]RED16763.1 3-isopropylmalate/(R)-2-methylmalate dehydratase small subunit [Parasphingopyxis lamellibrachiae]